MASPVSELSATLSVESLRATRRAVAFALRSETGVPGEPPDLSAGDPTEMLRAIRRHRVGIILAPHAATLGLDQATSDALAADSARQRLAAMKLAAETIEVTTALREAGIAVLVLKGVALAAQTTGDYTSRGPGDVDLWMDPTDIAAAVQVLRCIGFAQPPGASPPPSAGWQWRYVQWSYPELALHRGDTHADLHWASTGPRSIVPDFATVWSRRQTVSIGGTELQTLGVADSGLHTCTHAYVDQWRWLRSLVDVARLSSMTGPQLAPELSDSRTVTLSADVTRACFGAAACTWPGAEPRLRRRALATSRQAQLDLGQAVNREWQLTVYHQFHRHQFAPANELTDYLRAIASTALPPNSLVDANTSEPLSPAGAVAKRTRSVRARLAVRSTAAKRPDATAVQPRSPAPAAPYPNPPAGTRWRYRSRTAEALTLVSAARLLRAALPMRSWEKLVGDKRAADSATPATPTRPEGLERTVAVAIRSAEYRAPFHTTCLDQALAARWMLLRRGERPVLVIGLNRANLSDDPHAWLTGEHGGTVTGAAAMPDYVPVTEFR